uniref:Uncharacterized protein n=1 Tax=Knipowitschia caucasica TaxID=637954 RepID=A0AAV2LHU5_KNICA
MENKKESACQRKKRRRKEEGRAGRSRLCTCRIWHRAPRLCGSTARRVCGSTALRLFDSVAPRLCGSAALQGVLLLPMALSL